VTRTAYDSVNPWLIPVDARIVCGYVDGRYGPQGQPPEAWTPDAWRRFPTASHGYVSVWAADLAGNILDIEPQNATPEQAPGWAHGRRATASPPTPGWPDWHEVTCYVDRSEWPLVVAAFQAAAEPQPWYWVATLDDTRLPLGGPDRVVACQYTDTGAYDLSDAVDYWPGVDPLPRRRILLRERSLKPGEDTDFVCNFTYGVHLTAAYDQPYGVDAAAHANVQLTAVRGDWPDQHVAVTAALSPRPNETLGWDVPAGLAEGPGIGFVRAQNMGNTLVTVRCQEGSL